MKYAVYERGDYYEVLVQQKDGTFVPFALAENRASAEIIVNALNAKVEKKKEKKNARA